jgi:hypothetical protein
LTGGGEGQSGDADQDQNPDQYASADSAPIQGDNPQNYANKTHANKNAATLESARELDEVSIRIQRDS